MLGPFFPPTFGDGYQHDRLYFSKVKVVKPEPGLSYEGSVYGTLTAKSIVNTGLC
jgi:hypothetical protein